MIMTISIMEMKTIEIIMHNKKEVVLSVDEVDLTITTTTAIIIITITNDRFQSSHYEF
jgi:hypothetical protein